MNLKNIIIHYQKSLINYKQKYKEEDIRILVEGLNNNIEGVLNKMIPYTEKANKLDEEQHLLYMSIKEKYPNITDRELYDELIPYISKVDEDFEI